MGHLLKTLVAFLVLCLLEQDAHGAPAKGRYMWVRCRPDGRNANCVKEGGPWISLPRSRDRLPQSAVKDIIKASLNLDLQSTDVPGTSGLLVDSGSGDQSSSDWGSGDKLSVDWQVLGLHTAEGRVQLVEGSGLGGSSSEGSGLGGGSSEGSGSVLDYTEFVFPQSMTVQQKNVPHTLELQEDNFNV